MANLGIKGVVMTLYYSDLGEPAFGARASSWDAHVVERASDGDGGPEQPSPRPGRRHARAASPRVRRPPARRVGGAVERARARLAGAAPLTLADRASPPRRAARIILRRREEIIDRIQRDTGKCRSDALISEIFGVLDNLAWLEKHARKALADHKVHTPLALMGKTSWTWYEPLGTILVISPWNYPFYQAIVPIACAFAAGNTVVHKPSEWTPLEGLVEDLLARRSSPPTGCKWSTVTAPSVRSSSTQQPDKIFFTGSTRTGRKILAQAAEHLIPVELELGGKDAMIVFDDVNIARAAAGAAWGALTTTGQSCTSVERVYVQTSSMNPSRRRWCGRWNSSSSRSTPTATPISAP